MPRSPTELQTALDADDQAEATLHPVTPEQAQIHIAELFDRHDGRPEPQEDAPHV